MLLRTRMRSCDIFKKTEFWNIWIALYLSINVIINVKINWWTKERFFYWYTIISLPTSQKTWISFVQTTTFLGLFIYFMSQKFCPIKHQIRWEAAIITWSRIIPSVQALTLSPPPAGYKMANTCVWAHVQRCPFPLFSNRSVLCAGGRNGHEPTGARDTLAACRWETNPWHTSSFKKGRNEKRIRRNLGEKLSLCPQSFFMFTWWGRATWAVKPWDLAPGCSGLAPHTSFSPRQNEVPKNVKACQNIYVFSFARLSSHSDHFSSSALPLWLDYIPLSCGSWDYAWAGNWREYSKAV